MNADGFREALRHKKTTDRSGFFGLLWKAMWRPRQDSNLRPFASYHYSFRYRCSAVCGLDYPFTIGSICPQVLPV